MYMTVCVYGGKGVSVKRNGGFVDVSVDWVVCGVSMNRVVLGVSMDWYSGWGSLNDVGGLSTVCDCGTSRLY